MPETAIPSPAEKPLITPSGIAVLWLGIGLVATGGALYSGVTMLLGILCLTTLTLARILCRQNLTGLELRRELPKTAFAGELFESNIYLKRHFRRDAYELEFRDSLLHSIANSEIIPHLPNSGESQLTVRGRLPRRGRHGRSRFEVKSAWPFGLYETRATGNYSPRPNGEPDEIVIFPRPLMPALLLQQLEKFQAESLAKDTFDLENAGDFRGIRPYRPGDPVKSIHWPATARSSELVVRDWDPPQPKPQRFGIILHSLSKVGQLMQPERFETAIRIAAGLLLYCRERRIPVSVSTDVTAADWLKIPDTTGYTSALTELALARPRGLKTAAKLKRRIRDFEHCERLFVISDSAVDAWKSKVAGRHPHLILSDPDSVAEVKHRRIRVAK